MELSHSFSDYENIYDIDNCKSNKDDSFIACFKLNCYIDDILKCYKSKDKIINQLEQDYHRQTIIIDKQKLKTSELFIDHIQTHLCYNKKKIFNDLTYETLIFLLCCQSSFGMPFEAMQNLYITDEDHFLVSKGELCNIKTTIELNDIVTITMETTFFIMCIRTEKITSTIPVCITVHLSENTDINNALMTWSFIKNI